MNVKKIDNRIRIMIENSVIEGYRSIFTIVGEKARDQVVILYQMLLKSQFKPRPTVLWCYKKELGFSTNRKKRMRQISRKQKTGNCSLNEDNPFELFIFGTNIRWCYYHETHRILGNTYDMLIFQDFEAITPNLLARTIETVEGGGLVVILLNTLNSLEQLYTMTMNVHNRYRTEASDNIVARFNERFILSLISCPKFIALDDRSNILPINSLLADLKPVPKKNSLDPLSTQAQELVKLKESLSDNQPLGSLVNCCKTLDQAKAVIQFVESLSKKTLRTTVSLTAARGRGKSAALGLAIAGAIAFNYCNIFVTSPSPENLRTVFEFILKGFEAIHLKQHLDFEVIQSNNPEFNKAIVRINVHRNFRQTIQYIPPIEAYQEGLLNKAAELVVIDEAAAIPLPIVKSLLGPYLVFLSSTINGYEGTGRSLSLKLLTQLRKESEERVNSKESRALYEVSLEESIRYKMGDPVEAWLNNFLCLDANKETLELSSKTPEAEDCQLYYINRDSLFSFHKVSELFLQKLMALYVSSHYKNSPNDLQMMSDAPAHHLFVLLPAMKDVTKAEAKIPDILCFIQVCLEGKISQQHIMNTLNKGQRASGDLIPWTLSQQFHDSQFASLSGARIIRIATNPNYQSKGYGTRALELLQEYYQSNFENYQPLIDENQDKCFKTDHNAETSEVIRKKELLPLLLDLKERRAERLDYLGVCYGLTSELFKFWKRNGFLPTYIRQTANDLTGENSCIMIKVINDGLNLEASLSQSWLIDFWIDFRRRFVSLLSSSFRTMSCFLAIEIIKAPSLHEDESRSNMLDSEELQIVITEHYMRRLQTFLKYSQSLDDILDLIPILSTLYFTRRLSKSLKLNTTQEMILLSIGLQKKSITQVSKEIDMGEPKIEIKIKGLIEKILDDISGQEIQSIEMK